MELQEDVIVDIPEKRLRYFGGPGKMLLPSRATVEKLVAQVPTKRLITTTLLRERLAEQFEVEGVCPVTTKKALKALAHDGSTDTAYWRVVKQDGGLMSDVPGGVQGHAAHLRDEGFAIDTSGKAPKVEQYKEYLVQFE